MSFCKFTDDSGNTYFLSAGQWLQSPDPGEYLEAIEVLASIDSCELFKAEQSLFLQIDSELQQRLTNRLGHDWQNMGNATPALHPGAGLLSSPSALPGRWPLILDAIYHGDIRFSKIAVSSTASSAPAADNRGLLRVKIRQELAAIVTREKAAAAQHSRLLGHESRTGRALIYTGAFFTGLWSAGNDFAQWLREVNDVLNPLQRSLRGIRASHIALRRNSQTGENLLAAYQDEVLTAERRELVQVLGFDPSKLNREQFQQAIEFADLIWEDPALQGDLRRFAKDYAQAQHPIELTEFSGAAAFEVLFTILLAAITGGAGLAASAAGLTRHFAHFRKVGDLLIEFGEVLKKHRYKLHRHSSAANQAPSFGEFSAEEVSIAKVTAPAGTRSSRRPPPKSNTVQAASKTELPKRARPAPDNWKSYQTHGVSSLPMQTPEGRAVVESYRSQGMDLETAVGYAEQLIRSGSTLPKKVIIKKGQTLYKAVPEGTMPGEHSAYFATRDDINRLEGVSYDEISDQLGIPLESQQTQKFDIVEVEALQDTEVFQSQIAPTTQCGYSQPGGATQTLITNRSAFSAPRSTGIKRP